MRGSGRSTAGPFAAGRALRSWSDHSELARELLGDDPGGIISALRRRSEQAPLRWTLADRLVMGQRSGWRALVRQTSTGTGRPRITCSPMPTRCIKWSSELAIANPDAEVTAVRGVLHGAMALYLIRYLNVPPARIMGEHGEQLDDLPADAEMIRAALLDAFDRQRQVDLAARLVARHLALGHSPQALIATLARGVLREDAGFHAYQMLEAGVRQFMEWGSTDEGRNILIGVARYLAAHSPTERAALQTAGIARRLMRGGELHKEAAVS